MARIARKRRPIEIPPELAELSDQIGDFLEYWGFKKIHGRIWLHLYVAQQPLDAGDLIYRLNISRALVSISITDLLEYSVIQPAGSSSAGTILYRANPELLKVITHVLRIRERKMLARIKSASLHLDELAGSTKERAELSTERVQHVRDITDGAYKLLNFFLKYIEGENPELKQLLKAFSPLAKENS